MAINVIMYGDEDRNAVMQQVYAIDLVRPHRLECKLYRKKRTLAQNSLYHLWKAAVARETGYTIGWLHDFWRDRYLPKEVRIIFGETKEYLMSTTSLNTSQFTFYLDCIVQFAAERAIKLPDPKDREFEVFYEKYKDLIEIENNQQLI